MYPHDPPVFPRGRKPPPEPKEEKTGNEKGMGWVLAFIFAWALFLSIGGLIIINR